MRAMILQRSEGTIGEVASLLAAAAEAAPGWPRTDRRDRGGKGQYQPPSVRRRLFERQLR